MGLDVTTFLAWPEKGGRPPFSFWTAKALNAVPARNCEEDEKPKRRYVTPFWVRKSPL